MFSPYGIEDEISTKHCSKKYSGYLFATKRYFPDERTDRIPKKTRTTSQTVSTGVDTSC